MDWITSNCFFGVVGGVHRVKRAGKMRDIARWGLHRVKRAGKSREIARWVLDWSRINKIWGKLLLELR